MREVDTNALAAVAGALGIGAPSSVTRPVLFDDDNLQQVLTVEKLIRRARTKPPTLGLAYIATSNVHASGAASTVTTSIQNPYTFNGTETGYQPFWPAPIDPDEFDVWLLSAVAETAEGEGNLSSFQAVITPASALLISGTAVNLTDYPFLVGAGEVTRGVTTYLRHNPAEAPAPPVLPIRLHPRGSMVWQTITSGVPDSTYNLTILVGLFPAGLGQDVIGAG